MVSLTWTATTFVSNVRIILLPPELLAPTAPHLQLSSSAIGLTSAGTNTCSAGTRSRETRLFCLGPSSRLSSEKVRRTPGHLLTLSRVESGEIPSTSMRKFRIELPISSISNPFSLNSMLTRLQKSPPSFAYSERGSSLQLRHRWSNVVGRTITGRSW